MRQRSIGLDDDDMRDVMIEQAAANKDSFTTSRVEWVLDLALDRAFAGSMSCDRAKVGPRAGCPFADRSAPPSYVAASACRTLLDLARCSRPTLGPVVHIAVWLGRECHRHRDRRTKTGPVFGRSASNSHGSLSELGPLPTKRKGLPVFFCRMDARSIE
jgi:hypothetical protein